MERNIEARLEKIKQYMSLKTRAQVSELAREFGVTPETMRKDLTYLEDRGFLYRTHGGAILRDSNIDVPMTIRVREKTEIKTKICYEALNFIKNDDVVFFDPSSTSLPLARLIRVRKNLIVVTNSIDLLLTASGLDGDIFFLGGEYSNTGRRVGGHFPIAMIEKFVFSVSFFGTDGFKDLDGPGTQTKDAIALNAAVMRRSKTNVLLADSSKFALPSRFQYARFNEFDAFITNEMPADYGGKIDAKQVIITK